MNLAELKLELFRKIDALDKSKLEEVYGVFLNFLNSKNEYKEWESLTKAQEDAILYGVKELDEGQGRKNDEVLKKYRNKYPNA
jgi:hypothetical protein